MSYFSSRFILPPRPVKYRPDYAAGIFLLVTFILLYSIAMMGYESFQRETKQRAYNDCIVANQLNCHH